MRLTTAEQGRATAGARGVECLRIPSWRSANWLWSPSAALTNGPIRQLRGGHARSGPIVFLLGQSEMEQARRLAACPAYQSRFCAGWFQPNRWRVAPSVTSGAAFRLGPVQLRALGDFSTIGTNLFLGPNSVGFTTLMAPDA